MVKIIFAIMFVVAILVAGCSGQFPDQAKIQGTLDDDQVGAVFENTLIEDTELDVGTPYENDGN